MPTKLSVFNDCLGLLGQTLLDSDLDDNEDGDTLRGHWQSVIELAHEKTAWDFAKLRAECARSATEPVSGYLYYYTVPSDCLRILTVSASGIPGDNLIDWDGEPGKIATDAETVYITYVSTESLTQVGRWSASFAYYVATELAIRSAPKINASAVENITKERKKALSDAIGLDATQGPIRRRAHGSWSSAALVGRRSREQSR